MLRFHDIVALAPHTYINKTSHSNNCQEIDDFIKILEKKLSDVHISCLFETKAGLSHKLKFNQFESHFFKKCNLIVYIVCLLSEDSFRKSMKRLISTCHHGDKLSRIMVISLDATNFPELHNCEIEIVHLGNNLWEFEQENQWSILEEKLKTKLQHARTNNNSVPNDNNSLTLPQIIPQPKSPSKIKNFFSNHHPKNTFGNGCLSSTESAPNKIISNSYEENNVLRPPERDHHSKFSLNSIFRKRIHRSNDTVKGIDSPTSSCSDSKTSETMSYGKSKSMDVNFEVECETSEFSDKSKIPSEKSKKGKSKIHRSKDKVNTVLLSSNCIHSPSNRRKRNITDALSGLAIVSNFLIATTSDLFVNDLNKEKIKSSRGQRCQSEPLHTDKESLTSSPVVNRIKEQLWDENMINVEECYFESFEYHEDNDLEMSLHATEYEAPGYMMPDHCPITCHHTVINRVVPLVSEDNNTEHDRGMTEDTANENYFQVNYAPGSEQNAFSTKKSYKNGSSALGSIAEDIQKNYMKTERENKSIINNDTVPKTFKVKDIPESKMKNEKTTLNASIDSESPVTIKKMYHKIDQLKETILTDEFHLTIPKEELKLHTSIFDEKKFFPTDLQSSPLSHPISFELESASSTTEPHMDNIRYSFIKNPIVVGSIFTVTALTAPLWSSYIPHDLNVGQILYSSMNYFLKTEAVQCIPNQLVSAARIGSIAASSSLKRFFVLVPNTNLFNSYKIILC